MVDGFVLGVSMAKRSVVALGLRRGFGFTMVWNIG